MSKGFALGGFTQNIPSFKEENESIAGENIEVTIFSSPFIKSTIQLHFLLPDGKKLTGTVKNTISIHFIMMQFKAGQDVEWAKDFISKQIECNINDIV